MAEIAGLSTLSVEVNNRPGAYIFKVSLGRAWRRIAIDHQETLEDLANVILYAVDFDRDSRIRA